MEIRDRERSLVASVLSTLAEESLIDLILVGVIMGTDTRRVFTGPRLLTVAISIGIRLGLARAARATSVGAAWGLGSIAAEELLVDGILVGVVVRADSGGLVTVPVFLTVTVGVGAGRGVLALNGALAEELLVNLVFVAVVVCADTGTGALSRVVRLAVAFGVSADGDVVTSLALVVSGSRHIDGLVGKGYKLKEA